MSSALERRPRVHRWIAALCGLVLLACGEDPQQASTGAEPSDAPNVTRQLLDGLPRIERPNILLIVIDTLRRDHLGAYGYERATSPHIDALAARSIRYDRAYAQSSWTTPSTAALLSARYPSELAIKRQPNPLADEIVLLPEVLRGLGYRTGGIVSHMYIAERWNFDQGYDFFDERNALGHDAVTSPSVTDLAIEFVEKNFTKQPSFLFVHYFDPHFLYVEQEGHAFSDDPDYQGWIASGVDMLQLMRDAQKVGSRDLAKLLSLYDSEIAFTDRHIGRLLDRLRALELFDDTLIVLTADHGEEFLDHGGFNHALTLYEEQIHVPLIVKWPRARTGAVSERVVQLIDVFPSVLDYLGIEVDHPISGVAIQQQEAPRPAFSETSRTGADQRAMVTAEDKIIWNLSPKPGEPAVSHYRLDADPHEKSRLEPVQSTRARELGRELVRHVRDLEQREARKAPDLILTDAERERLEALGYVE